MVSKSMVSNNMNSIGDNKPIPDLFKSDSQSFQKPDIDQRVTNCIYELGKTIIFGAYELGKAIILGAYELGKAVVELTYELGKAIILGAYELGKTVVELTYELGKAIILGAYELGKGIYYNGKTIMTGLYDLGKSLVDVTYELYKNRNRQYKHNLTDIAVYGSKMFPELEELKKTQYYDAQSGEWRFGNEIFDYESKELNKKITAISFADMDIDKTYSQVQSELSIVGQTKNKAKEILFGKNFSKQYEIVKYMLNHYSDLYEPIKNESGDIIGYNIEELSFKNIDKATLDLIAEKCPKLKKLSIQHNSQGLVGQNSNSLKYFKELEELNLYETGISPHILKDIVNY